MKTIKVILTTAAMLLSALATAGSGGEAGARRPLKADTEVAAAPHAASREQGV